MSAIMQGSRVQRLSRSVWNSDPTESVRKKSSIPRAIVRRPPSPSPISNPALMTAPSMRVSTAAAAAPREVNQLRIAGMQFAQCQPRSAWYSVARIVALPRRAGAGALRSIRTRKRPPDEPGGTSNEVPESYVLM